MLGRAGKDAARAQREGYGPSSSQGKEKERGKPNELLDEAWVAKRALPGRQR